MSILSNFLLLFLQLYGKQQQAKVSPDGDEEAHSIQLRKKAIPAKHTSNNFLYLTTERAQLSQHPSAARPGFNRQHPRILRVAGVSGANREATAGCNIDFYGGHTAVEETNVFSQCPKRTKLNQTNQDP